MSCAASSAVIFSMVAVSVTGEAGRPLGEECRHALVQVVAVEDRLLRDGRPRERSVESAVLRGVDELLGELVRQRPRAAMVAASARAASSAEPSTTRLTRPQASALSASIVSPVNRSSFARDGPTSRVARTAPFPASPPSRDSVNPSAADRVQTRRSHASASSKPPPSAGPSIAAMVGTGIRASRRSTMSS
jgi:hypothetical protein